MKLGAENKATDEFTTSFGREVEHIPGYFDYMKEIVGFRTEPEKQIELAATNVGDGKDNFDYKRAATLSEKASRLPLLGYSSRYANAYRLVKILEAAGIERRFSTMLDIGCGHGFQPRILRGLGVVDNCTGIDLYDRASPIDELHLLKQHRRLRLMKFLDLYHDRISQKPAHKRSEFENALIQKNISPRARIHNKVGWKPEMDFYSFKLKKKPTLDRFITGNVFDVAEKFSLVTAFSAFEWFDNNEILAKVSDMLEDGGVLYFYVANWWHSVTGGRVAGHFPFTAQRLTHEDFRRYVESQLPEYATAMKAHYEFFDPHHPTMRDYLDTAAQYNLLPVWYQSCVSPIAFNPKYGLTSRGWGEMQVSELSSVIEDIRQFKPNISISDIMPTTHYMAFQKVDPNQRIKPEEFNRLSREHHTPYNPKGLIGKTLKKWGGRLLNDP